LEDEKVAGQVVYAPLLENLLTQERARKSSLEQRGQAVITTSGVLVSLLVALAAVVTNATVFTLPGASRKLFIGALILFVLAAVSGIISNSPLAYRGMRTEDLHRIVAVKNWYGAPEIAAQRVAQSRVAILERTRKLNHIKAYALFTALVFQVLAVMALAASVTIMLFETN
jgi:hypothetical protein